MPQCSAFNCRNRGSHLFPKDPKRRKRWESALRIRNFKATPTARLCAAHFKEEDYIGKSIYTDNEPIAKFLKKTSVPSIFCFTSSKPENAAARQRKQRLEKRNQKKPLTSKDRPIYEPQPLTSKITPTNEPQPSTSIPESHYKPTCDLEIACKEEAHVFEFAQVDHEYMYGSINNYIFDNEAIMFYTGFESYKKFQFVYSTLSPMAHTIKYYGRFVNLKPADQFFLTLMKLRQNKCNFELSKFFNVSQTTVSNIFITWINFIYQLWSKMSNWPSKESAQYYMPENFKNYDRNIRVVLDDTEIEKVQKPKNSRINALTNTYKILKNDLNHNYIPIAGKIFLICLMCCKYRETITKK